MRITDDRYAGERERLDLALRLIRLQARTHIITFCTGFSQDRVRKLYTTYFKYRDEQRVKRHRGKSPSSVEFFVRNPWTQAEASLLAHLFAAWGLMRILPDLRATPCRIADAVSFGQRLCEAYEEFRETNPGTAISFEHAWNLLGALTEREALLHPLGVVAGHAVGVVGQAGAFQHPKRCQNSGCCTGQLSLILMPSPVNRHTFSTNRGIKPRTISYRPLKRN